LVQLLLVLLSVMLCVVRSTHPYWLLSVFGVSVCAQPASMRLVAPMAPIALNAVFFTWSSPDASLKVAVVVSLVPAVCLESSVLPPWNVDVRCWRA